MNREEMSQSQTVLGRLTLATKYEVCQIPTLEEAHEVVIRL
ncbi:MAG: hypothetical protein ACI9ON_001351 [Limisphaerales bacterium]|jgi:hypothetical protein